MEHLGEAAACLLSSGEVDQPRGVEASRAGNACIQQRGPISITHECLLVEQT